ncbi:MAG: DegT/DnrJ/EryC1/StrS family aminotransferase [Victivallaceae bacterium]|nr:DegT/DnrJ/EryC1/StrS family aminotransferase [Victivallaceae bacterium]
MQVSLLDLRAQYATFKDKVLPIISDICDSQKFILGDKVSEFEAALAAYCTTAGAVGVTSGSDALIVALMAEGIGAGDEVITTPFTFFATVGAIVRVGARPVFADIDPVTFNIDPAEIAKKITPRTKAIIPVHLFGQAADMSPIMALAKENNLIVIEDGCQAIGAEYDGQRVGSFGDYGCFSFFPSKNLGCFGDGGAVTCKDAAKADLVKVFRNHGQSKTYIHEYVGGNFRLDALQAAILSVKLPLLDSWSEARQRNAAEYAEMFAAAGITEDDIILPKAEANRRHIYNQYCIRVTGGRRDALKAFLQENKIGCAVYYPLSLHLQPCFANLGGKPGDFPVSEKTTGEIMALPIYGECPRDQREFVVGTIAKFLGK